MFIIATLNKRRPAGAKVKRKKPGQHHKILIKKAPAGAVFYSYFISSIC